MGLFSKLFSKKENEPNEKKTVEPKEDKIFFDDEYCRFYYINNPNCEEFGYEGEIEPEGSSGGTEALGIYIDTESPETTEAAKCHAMFRETMADLEHFTFEAKKAVADHFLFAPEYNEDQSTEQQLMDSMRIFDMEFFRNGSIILLIDFPGEHGVYASEIHLTLYPDGSREIEYTDYNNEKHKKKC